ncbi:MAG: 3D domain-containing protein [Paraclostridium sp.]|uniref:G5 and 3D domain-containing protein n=1 Tax=Paraclostridium sp. TaxID=2023273 RepID=UPI003F2A7BDD
MELKNKKNLIGLLGIVAIFGGIFLGYETSKKDVKIITTTGIKEISTFKYTIDDIIKEHNLKFDNDDIANVTLNGIKKESIKLETKLKDNMVIELIDVCTGVVSEYKEINFETKIVEDKNVLKGKSLVYQEGEKGKNNLIYNVVYHNGKLVEKNFSKELVYKDPKDKIISKGSKVFEEIVVATSRVEATQKTFNSEINDSISVNKNQSKTDNGNSTEVQTVSVNSNDNNSTNHMSVVATAYAGDSITSTGTIPKWGTIAVDPRIIPYGTKVYIPQFGQTFVAEDCGGAIKGNKIDIFMNSENEAYDWGRRTIDIYIQS